MSFSLNCPHCQARLKASEKLIGRTLSCPKCSRSFSVEAAEAPDLSLAPIEDEPALSPVDPSRPAAASVATHRDGVRAEHKPVAKALPGEPDNRKRTIMLAAGAAALIVVLVVGAVIAFWRPGGDDRQAAGQNAQGGNPQAQAQAGESTDVPAQAGTSPSTAQQQPVHGAVQQPAASATAEAVPKPSSLPLPAEWVKIQPQNAFLTFTVEFPGEPKESTITVDGTSFSHSLWSLNLGPMVFSVRPGRSGSTPQDHVESTQKLELENRKAGGANRTARKLSFGVPDDFYSCGVQRYAMPEWKKWVSLSVDSRGRYVGGTYELPEKVSLSVDSRGRVVGVNFESLSQELPAAVGFQMVYAERAGLVSLVVEVRKDCYEANQQQVEADVERFFASFDRPELQPAAQAALKQQLIDHFPALVKTLEAGDAKASYAAVYPPSLVASTMRGSDPDGTFARFQEERVPRLIEAFKRFDPQTVSVIGNRGQVTIGSRQFNVYLNQGNWYLENVYGL
ncbi:MAG: hypothetical protein J5I93_28395 [Pirellulaceae bacterium]|nr:hypothetical protein [Pirellulaceae bacterium]